MILMVKIFVIILIINLVDSLRLLSNTKINLSRNEEAAVRKTLQALTNSKILFSRRAGRADKLAKVRSMFKALTKNLAPEDVMKILRKETEDTTESAKMDIDQRDEQAYVDEGELRSVLTRESALNDRPYVEKKGKDDYLVMRPDVTDPFVTVIPNAIYYNIEKKCVNWLDDCSLQGIRARLLRGVQSPYK